MKYFGARSLSSFMSGFLRFAWYVVLIGAIIGTILGSLLMVLFSAGNALTTAGTDQNRIASVILDQCPTARERSAVEDVKGKVREQFGTFKSRMSEKDRHDFEKFIGLPVFVKILMVPYFWAVVVLLLMIIRKSRLLFENLRKDILFNRSNVTILSATAKLNIAFSILTFSISSLVTSVFLLMACEVLRSGTALQEEHDLTI